MGSKKQFEAPTLSAAQDLRITKRIPGIHSKTTNDGGFFHGRFSTYGGSYLQLEKLHTIESHCRVT